MGSPWSCLGSWTPHTDQACTHLLRPSRGSSDGGSGKNEGSSVFCRDRGGGEARARRGRLPAPSRSPHRVCCGHRPRVACPCGQTAPAHPAWPQLPRLTPPWECQPGQGSFSPPCSLFSSSATQKEKKKKKKRKKLLRDDSELFAKVPFISMQRGHPSPTGYKRFPVHSQALPGRGSLPGPPPHRGAAEGRRSSSLWSLATRRPVPQHPPCYL